MKFTRRHDLDPQTRIEIVKDVWINQGLYGKMTQIAQEYHISRTFLYQLRHGAEIISRFISACIMASAPEHFSGRITHCLKHVAA